MSQNRWHWCCKLGLASLLGMGYAIAASRDCTLAQITPDGTLGAESSVVTPTAPGETVDVIEGGATRGANLFHSFEQFSVLTGRSAFFNNTADIQNIISRVTGSSISNIDGLIRANGAANLFLLNPNGISFGSNAALNIGGSFVGSTASSLNFADGTQFSATAPTTTPLLTVSVPLGLQYGGNPGRILVQGNGQGLRTTSALIDTTVGLRVQPNQTLAIVGGDVALSGGTLKTAGGRIELGSVAGSGLVSLTPIDSGWALGYSGVPTYPSGSPSGYGDIQLSGGAAVDASGEGGGDIQVRGRRVTLTDGSQIEASTLGSEPGGNLNVTASESVELIGESADGQFLSGLFNGVYKGATGSGGNLTIETGQLIRRNGALLDVSSLGQGSPGKLTVISKNFVEGQIIPDETLPVSSTVSLDGNTSIIEGGTQVGSNLFHSFAQFSVPTLNTAYFNNALDIQNIIARVTGGSVSNIDGLLQANASANLFLLNPNGNIFGPNATLNIGGSFLASTASSLKFEDGTEFSATAPQTTALLTISVPTGLQFGGTAGGIRVDDLGLSNSLTRSLQVQSGKTLALVGGDVSLDGGNLQAPGGRVELGGVAEPGTVGLNTDGSLNFPNSVARADVSVTNGAVIDVLAEDGGSIAINARNLNISGESALAAGIGENLGSIGSQAGDITLNAAGTITIANSFVDNNVGPGSVGNGGNININARSLSITDDAQLSASTFGRGNSGSIFLQADNSVSLARNSAVFNQVQAGGVGNGGDINITAGSLSLTDGAQLQTFVNYDNTNKLPDGRGNAGDVNINVRDTVTLVGKGRDSNTAITAIWTGVGFGAVGNGGDINILAKALSLTNAALGADTNGQGDAGNVFVRVVDSIYLTNSDFVLEGSRRSRIGSAVGFRAVGNGGDIDIQSRSLFLGNGAVLDASTQGKGNGSNIRVSADTFAATNGGQIFTTTRSSGRAGSISLNVTDSVTLSGSDPKFAQRRARSEPSIPIPDSPASGLFANTTPDSTGDGGSISIDPIKLTIMDGAGVAVDSQGTGNAGDLLVQAGGVTLDGGAFLSAAAASGKGGNIRLYLQELLLMRGNSQISANSGSLGNEGNITIDTGILAAFENSDIIANAFAEPAANIQITAQGIFGTQTREQQTLGSDITASGNVEVNTPDVDPSQGLATLPAELVEASGLITSSCAAVGENKFVITGRGGLPIRPQDADLSPYPTGTVRSIPNSGPSSDSPRSSVEGSDPSTNFTRRAPTQIVEATGWVINNKDQVVLVATAPTPTLHIPWLPSATCHTP